MRWGAGTDSPQEFKVDELIIHLWRLLGPQKHSLASLGQKWGLEPLWGSCYLEDGQKLQGRQALVRRLQGQ